MPREALDHGEPDIGGVAVDLVAHRKAQVAEQLHAVRPHPLRIVVAAGWVATGRHVERVGKPPLPVLLHHRGEIFEIEMLAQDPPQHP